MTSHFETIEIWLAARLELIVRCSVMNGLHFIAGNHGLALNDHAALTAILIAAGAMDLPVVTIVRFVIDRQIVAPTRDRLARAIGLVPVEKWSDGLRCRRRSGSR